MNESSLRIPPKCQVGTVPRSWECRQGYISLLKSSEIQLRVPSTMRRGSSRIQSSQGPPGDLEESRRAPLCVACPAVLRPAEESRGLLGLRGPSGGSTCQAGSLIALL